MQIITGARAVQGSDEWLLFRRSKLMASEISAVSGVSPWKTQNQLWREKVLGDVKPVFLPATERGKSLEEPARLCAEEMLGMSFTPLVVISDEHPRFGASLDGYDPMEDVVIEIKAPNPKTHADALNGIIPEHYRLQVQFQLLVTGAKRAVYFSFGGLDGHVIWVEPCQDTFNRMIAAGERFLRFIDDLEEPPLTDADTYVETSEEWLEIAELKKKTAAALKQAEYEDKVVNTKLEELANGRVRIKGGGISYSQSLRKGSIDYSLAVKELGIPQSTLDTYRRSPSVSTTIRVG